MTVTGKRRATHWRERDLVLQGHKLFQYFEEPRRQRASLSTREKDDDDNEKEGDQTVATPRGSTPGAIGGTPAGVTPPSSAWGGNGG